MYFWQGEAWSGLGGNGRYGRFDDSIWSEVKTAIVRQILEFPFLTGKFGAQKTKGIYRRKREFPFLTGKFEAGLYPRPGIVHFSFHSLQENLKPQNTIKQHWTEWSFHSLQENLKQIPDSQKVGKMWRFHSLQENLKRIFRSLFVPHPQRFHSLQENLKHVGPLLTTRLV